MKFELSGLGDFLGGWGGVLGAPGALGMHIPTWGPIKAPWAPLGPMGPHGCGQGTGKVRADPEKIKKYVLFIFMFLIVLFFEDLRI